MKLNKLLIGVVLGVGVLIAGQVHATEFFRTGSINRFLTDELYGGCMIRISAAIGNGCPATGWVSLDCEATHSPAGVGNRMYATALTAFSLGRQVTVLVDNTELHNGYCVARRLDML